MAWLGTWAKRISITADHTLVDSDLTDFPVLLKVSTASGITSADISAIFDELTSDANRKKIAITKSDEITECYCEIDNWDDATETAYLWVKCPSMSSSVDQVFYIYYDSAQLDNTSYVGDTGDTPAENVWDSNFKMVQHMKDTTTSTITDSTSNSNDGTKVAANEPIEANGKIHKGQDHDGSNDHTDITSASAIHAGNYTISAIAKPTVGITSGQNEMTIAMDVNNYTFYFMLSARNLFGQGPGWGIGWYGASGWKGASTGDTVASQLDIWTHVVGSYDGTTFKISENGALSNLKLFYYSGSAGLLTRLGYYNDTYREQFNGIIDEVRISNTARSAAWNKADYNSCWDTLFTYGSEELRPSGTVMAGYYYRLLMQGA